MSTCTCTKHLTLEEAVVLIDQQGQTLAVFARSCALHGVEVLSETFTPYRKEYVEKWLHKSKLRDLRNHEEVILLDVTPDGQHGLVRWAEYTLVTSN